MSSVRTGREREAAACRILRASGHVVHRTIRHAVKRGGNTYSEGNDVFGCIDILAKKQGRPMRYVQVTSDASIASKIRDLQTVPWDPDMESVEIWQWIPRSGPRRPAHFRVYRMQDHFDADACFYLPLVQASKPDSG